MNESGPRSRAVTLPELEAVLEERPTVVTRNERAFRVLVRNAMFRRVELAALRYYHELGELDADSGWDTEAWASAMEPYFEEYSQIGTGPDARGLMALAAGLEVA